MNKSKFLLIFSVINVFFIFLKIYQHNVLIKLNYEKQRLEKNRNFLKKNKNELLVELSKIKNQEDILNKATQKFGMKNLQLSQIITNTVNEKNF